jgi:hypothetical protein
MPNRFAYMALAAAAASLVDVSSALASPEVRDHRTDTPSVESGRTYRRRPGPRIMLPLKFDLGATGADTMRGMASGIAGSIGIHWASLAPRPTDTDVGIGLFGAILGAKEDTSVMDDNNTVAYGGAYLELGHTLSRGSWWRTWASGRGEYLGSTAFGNDHGGFGASARLSAELFASGIGIEPRGIFLGTYAVGVYVEAGLRDTATGMGDFHATAGLQFRTPTVFAF